MANRVLRKHERDQALDLEGFLNDLQDWELSFRDKDKKMHKKQPQASLRKIGEDGSSTAKTPAIGSQYSHTRNFDAINHVSTSFMDEESTVDAASEKELGNEYFKQKKFNEAIDCYSRSIALSPTAVAYANRAMAYLKIKRFREVEEDCTEALNLDDRYIKAYSRRATARKELGKLKESIEDSEFALRLEPHNQEIKKQYAGVKSLYEKVILQKASTTLKNSAERAEKGGRSKARVNGLVAGSDLGQTDKTMGNDCNIFVEELENNDIKAGSKTEGQEVNNSLTGPKQRNHRTAKQELKESVQELASRAASRAMTEAAKNMRPPNSAYQFEVSWRGFSGDCALQTRFLKVTSPIALPQIFKNALSAPILLDIIKCVATFFTDDMDLAVKYLENLTKVPRFDMLMMCLSATEKADLLQLWDEVFCHEATSMEYTEIIDNLRSKYCLN